MITWTKHYQMWLWNLKPGDIVYVNQAGRGNASPSCSCDC